VKTEKPNLQKILKKLGFRKVALQSFMAF